MAGIVCGEVGQQLTEAAVHARHEVTVVLHIFAERKQEAGATVAVDDFPCLRGNEDGIKTVRLLAVKLYPAIVDAVGGKGKQVADVYAKETERENKTVNVAHLPVLHGHRCQRTQNIGREVTLGCFYATNFKLAERIEGGHFLVYGIVENRTYIPQVNVAGIDRGRLSGKMKEEGAQPVGGDLREGKAGGGRVELRNALPCCFIDFTSAAVFQSADILLKYATEGDRFRFGGRGGGEHEVTQLASGAVSTEVWRHNNGLKQAVIIPETVEQVIIKSLAVGTDTHTRAHRVPFRGEDGLREGDKSSRAVMVDLYAEGTRTVMLWAASVEV